MIQAGVSQPVPQAPVLAERRPSVLARRWQGFGELIDGVPLVIVDRINVARAGRTVAGAGRPHAANIMHTRAKRRTANT